MVNKARNRVRIIAGRLRGRMISFPDQTGLRPTGDRIRETLFSWLQPSLPGSHCLDMFAGSGVLGFEAISRGAADLLLLDKSPIVVRELQANCKLLGLSNVEVDCADATRVELLAGLDSNPFDVVFIDPPFADGLHLAAVQALCKGNMLAEGALVAIECDKQQAAVPVPDHWELWREKQTGNVRLRLYRVN